MTYRDLLVWDDETGERYYIQGHVNDRRALAAVNRYVREACGREDRNDQLADVGVTDVGVRHRWVRPAPQFPGDDESAAWCGPEDPQADAVTEVWL